MQLFIRTMSSFVFNFHPLRNFHLYNATFHNEKLKKGLHIVDEKHILNENLEKCLQNMDEKIHLPQEP